jgi:hypothetical protein
VGAIRQVLSTSCTNETNDSRSLSIRHPRESGGPGQVLAPAPPVPARGKLWIPAFAGMTKEVAFVGAKRQKCIISGIDLTLDSVIARPAQAGIRFRMGTDLRRCGGMGGRYPIGAIH